MVYDTNPLNRTALSAVSANSSVFPLGFGFRENKPAITTVLQLRFTHNSQNSSAEKWRLEACQARARARQLQKKEYRVPVECNTLQFFLSLLQFSSFRS